MNTTASNNAVNRKGSAVISLPTDTQIVITGGTWRWASTHTNDEGSFPVAFHGQYKEISGPNRLVYTEVFEGAPGGDENGTRQHTLVLEEVDGVTTMTSTADCPERWIRDAIIDSGMEHGMQISMDRLEEAAQSLR